MNISPDKVSDTDRGGQQTLSMSPDVIPFDAAGDADGDGPDDTPPAGGAAARPVGRPCTLAHVRQAGRVWGVCAVKIVPDPDYPATTDDPDYHADGQEVFRLDRQDDALTLCELYACLPWELPPIGVKGANYLVVNDPQGKEILRRPLLQVA